MQFWNELEGQTIDGLYPLRRLVRSEGRSAWFETETVEPQRAAATISVTEALTDADEVTARLQAAHSLKHPNLVAITRIGQTRLDNTLLVYAVMENIEQSLSDVLQGQSLTPEEAREVAEALVGALSAIHQQGMSHGRVEAASVLATVEAVKLRSDCLQIGSAGQADDVAGIGATLFHAFTQRKALAATDPQINRIPAPFAEIVRNSFARRWTLAQVANALKPAPPGAPGAGAIPPAATSVPARPAPPVPPLAKPVPPVPPTAKPIPPEPAAVKLPPAQSAAVKAAEKRPPSQSAPPAVPVGPPIPPPTPSPSKAAEPVNAKRGPLPLYIAVAVAVLAILGWLIFRPRSAPAPANSTPQTALQTAPAAASPEVKPAPGRPARSSSTPGHLAQTPAGPAPSNRAAVWRVVVYTYRFQKPAAEKVAKINAQHADLGAAVFTPPGTRGVYLLTLGGTMDRDEALKMLDKARRDGLPSDSFIRKYPQ